jgi:hypothetical protein
VNEAEVIDALGRLCPEYRWMVGRYTDDSEPLLIEGERICAQAQVVIVRLVLHGNPETGELKHWAHALNDLSRMHDSDD